MTTQRTEPTFWAVHLSGQDDTYPAPTREEADAACLLINAAIARQTPPGHPVDVTATAIPWPYSLESWHAGVPDFYCIFMR